jgi:hypothetical protein
MGAQLGAGRFVLAGGGVGWQAASRNRRNVVETDTDLALGCRSRDFAFIRIPFLYQ